MNDDIIARLRDATTAVGDTVHDVPGLRFSAAGMERPEPRRKKSWFVPVVAAASVIAAITAGAVAVRAGTGPQVAAAGPAAVPKFFLVASTGSLSVRGMNGEQVASVPAPSKDEVFWSAQAAEDNRRFYVSTVGPGCQGHFYRLTVDDSGAAQAFDRLPIELSEGTADPLAVSGDGSKLAYAIQPCRATDRTGGLVVADTASGETRTWKAEEGKIFTNVAMSGDGRYVAYQYPNVVRVYGTNTAEGGGRFLLTDPRKTPGPDTSAGGTVIVPAPGDATSVPAGPGVPPIGDTTASAPPSGDGTSVPAPSSGGFTLESAVPAKPDAQGYGTGEGPSRDMATPASPSPPGRTTRVVPPSPGAPGAASEPPSGPEAVPAEPAVPTASATVAVDPRTGEAPGPGKSGTTPIPSGRVEMAPDSPDVYLIDTTVGGEDLGTSRKITLSSEAVGGNGGLQGYRLNADGSRIIASLGRVVLTVNGTKEKVEPSTAAIVRFDASDGRLLETVYKDEKGGMRLLAVDGASERFIVRRGDEIAAVTASGYQVLTHDDHTYPSVTW
ncbi:hypothetical protein AB0M95_35490 [Sphaerisporangium sp. NPDC051017]|uniref:hypothetical protein n=1 Tax=Sphaerisporangium sp. NPDC051017 TaxID=3154636 RepID=UPI00341AEC23